MNYTKEEYIKKFMKSIYVSRRNKRRIREDITQRIEIAFSEDPFYNIYDEMGDPEELAVEFMENIEDKGAAVFVTIGISTRSKAYEYMSKSSIFGIPLVHINTGGLYRNKVAKGIIAIGDISFGIVSVGGIGIGLISLGGISLGAVAVGGIAIGGAAVGGIAIGGYAIGAIAVGFYKVVGEIIHLL